MKWNWNWIGQQRIRQRWDGVWAALRARGSQASQGRSPRSSRVLALLVPLVLLTGLLGLGLEQAWAQPPNWATVALAEVRPEPTELAVPPVTVAAVDAVPEQMQLGEQIYLRECSTCHIAPSPAVLPTQTWATLLINPDHYGQQIDVLQRPSIDLVWEYIQFTSRPMMENETAPDRIRDSRFFRALHPRVEIERADLGSCMSCHPNAWDYDYRTLSPEWADAP